MKLSVAIQDYLIEAEVRKYTPKTIKGKKTNLGLFLRFCEDVAGITEIENVSPAVVREFTRYIYTS